MLLTYVIICKYAIQIIYIYIFLYIYIYISAFIMFVVNRIRGQRLSPDSARAYPGPEDARSYVLKV